MKPFIRFANQADHLYGRNKTGLHPSLYWDFDDTLQKILLKTATTMANPQEIACSCVEQWKSNMATFVAAMKWGLNDAASRGSKPWFGTTPREEFVLARIPQRSRFLYVCCDPGMDYFRYAQRGYPVTGIDTDPGLVDILNDWAKYLDLPYKAFCMDISDLDFGPASFDTFLFGSYGSETSVEQLVAVQKNLAMMISQDGLGFVVANRKKCASYWFLTKTPYCDEMTRWLMKQAPPDFYYSECDSAEERLMYGLYNKSHTEETLSSELSLTFDVLECHFEEHDPRHVIGVVRRKSYEDIPRFHGRTHIAQENISLLKPYVWVTSKVRSICDILKSHEQKVSQFFCDRASFRGKTPFQAVGTDLSEFIHLLTEVFETTTSIR